MNSSLPAFHAIEGSTQLEANPVFARSCDLIPCELPLTIRGVNGKNHMTDQAEHRKYHQLWWESLRSELRSHPLSRENRKVFGRAYTGFLASEGPSSTAFLHLIRCLLAEPYLFRQSYGFFDLKLLKMTRSHRFAQRFLSAKNRLLGTSNSAQREIIDNTR